ncbi:MAG: signal recognition particle protein [Burkholderia sp.]|nr:signal recognition particle protein [Burkholderia sp.]
MFNNLTQRMAHVVKTLRGEARLTESNTKKMLHEVHLALLEADVSLPVVLDFIKNIKEKAIGENVISSLSPGQALVGVVKKELTALIGGNYEGRAANLNIAVTPPATILMVGLQGAGKTTTVGKLAKFIRKKYKKKVLTVSCDIYRPAAITQLNMVSTHAGADFFTSTPYQKPVDIALAALDWGKRHYHDVLIIDTAGRLGINEAMMRELVELHSALNPAETLFVLDSMLGQDAVNTAKAFDDVLPMTGVILTKLDGDSRGGAALSVRHVTGKPIKFIGMSEKLDGLEEFYPERMARRILGMGDILSIVEEAQRGIDIQSAQNLADKMKKGDEFDLSDFLIQISKLKSMDGGISSLINKLPMKFQQAADSSHVVHSEKKIRQMEGIINSMTPFERSKPEIIKATRKRRIAAGASVTVQDVNRMLNEYSQMRIIIKKLKVNNNMKKMIHSLKNIIPGIH